MKLQFSIAMTMAFLFFAICSCKKDDGCNDTLLLSTKTLNFTQQASSQSVTVTTNVKDWTATSASSWLTVVPANDGKSFLVQVTENVSPVIGQAAAARSALVLVNAGTLCDSVKVIQGEESKVFEVTAFNKLDVYPAEGGEVSVKVSCNSLYAIEGTTDWLVQETEETKAVFDDTVTFKILANKSTEPRKATLVFTSSAGDVKNVEISQNRMSKYTLMFYSSPGHGSDLDKDYVDQLYDIMYEGCSDTVRVVAQYNFMPEAQKFNNLKGTKRMVIKTSYLVEDSVNFTGCATRCDSTARMVDSSIEDGGINIANTVSNTPIRLANPANMADFIKWTVENQPAEQYILIVTGHGNGWNPISDANKTYTTKASAWDNNFEAEEGITAMDIVNGIKQSGYESKIQLIIQDACQMNFIENVAEYSTLSVPRALLPFQSITALNHEKLISKLKVSASLDEAVNAAGESFVTSDITYWDLTKVGDLLTCISSAVPDFIEDYKANSEIYNEWIDNLNSVNNISGDYYQFWNELPDKTKSKGLADKAVAVKAKFDAAATKTWFVKESKLKSNCKGSALFYNKTNYSKLSEKALESLSLNNFYKKTKWDEFFKVFTGAN